VRSEYGAAWTRPRTLTSRDLVETGHAKLNAKFSTRLHLSKFAKGIAHRMTDSAV
jgi:hypothetical protein